MYTRAQMSKCSQQMVGLCNTYFKCHRGSNNNFEQNKQLPTTLFHFVHKPVNLYV